MRTQSVLSIALVAFTSTLHAAPIQMTEDVKAAMGSVGRNLQMLSGRTSLASLVAANVVRDLQADAAALQAQSDAVHAGDAEDLTPEVARDCWRLTRSMKNMDRRGCVSYVRNHEFQTLTTLSFEN